MIKVYIYSLIPEEAFPLLPIHTRTIFCDVSGWAKFKRIEEGTNKPAEDTHNKDMPFSEERKDHKHVLNFKHSVVYS